MRLPPIFFIILLMLPAFLASVIPASSAVDRTTSPGTVVLQLKWQHQFQFAGFYAAVEKGYYRDVGLEVVFKEARPGLNFTAELTSGRADYLVSNPAALLARAAGEPVVALAAIFQHSPLVMVSLKESEILTPGDLIGRRAMFIPETESQLVAMFVSEGVDLNSLDIVPHSWDIADLVAGKVDAMSAYLTDVPFLLGESGVEYNLLRPLTYGIDFYGDVLFTTAAEIDDHPERVKAFRDASLQGWAYAMEHPEEIVDLILSRYGSRLSREALLYEAEAMQTLILPTLVDPGHMNPGRWQHIADIYISLGLLPNDFALDGFLYRPDEAGFWSREVFLGLLAVLVFCTMTVLILLLFNRQLRMEVQKSTRELRESEESLRQLADSMPQLVWSADPHGNIDYYNERRLEFKGFSQKADGSWEWAPVIHPDDVGKTVEAWRHAHETGTLFQIEHRIQRFDGTYTWNLSRAKRICSPEGKTLRWYGTTTDIDDLKKTEIELDIARRSAEEAHRVKSEFLAKMSHEIRTPMTIFMSAVEHLLELEEDPELLKILELADLSSQRLHTLVEEILDFSKIEGKKLDLYEESFDLRKCLEDAMKMMEPKASQKNLALELEISAAIPENIFGDEYRLGQILLNLIGNAIKFTDQGHVTVGVELHDNNLVFKVSDTGIGIPGDKLDNVFEAFSQADGSITRKHGGSGLGLAISRGLVELMGGCISVRSQVGLGSTFTFTLPIKNA